MLKWPKSIIHTPIHICETAFDLSALNLYVSSELGAPATLTPSILTNMTFLLLFVLFLLLLLIQLTHAERNLLHKQAVSKTSSSEAVVMNVKSNQICTESEVNNMTDHVNKRRNKSLLQESISQHLSCSVKTLKSFSFIFVRFKRFKQTDKLGILVFIQS